MVRIGRRSLLSLEGLGILILCFGIAGCQRTYQRTCDCEYMVDGKCAYTLLLPSGDGAQPSECSTGSGNDTAAFELFSEQLRRNLSELESFTGNQAKSIVSLQNTVHQQEMDLANIANGPGKNITSSCNGCPGLANNISGQETKISALEREVAQLSDIVASLARQIAGLVPAN